MTVLLDTCIVVDAINDRAGRRAFLRELISNKCRLASCALTVAEVYAGMRPKEAAITAEVFSTLNYFEMREHTAKLAGELKEAYARKGITLSLSDALIAAVALEHNLALATDNVKDFPMPELRLLPLPKAR